MRVKDKKEIAKRKINFMIDEHKELIKNMSIMGNRYCDFVYEDGTCHLYKYECKIGDKFCDKYSTDMLLSALDGFKFVTNEDILEKVVNDNPLISENEDKKYDALKPSHYNSGDFDVIAFCLKNNIDFCRGNIIKYVVRAGKKDKSKEIEDLEKAIEYIERIIEYLKGE